MWVAYAAESWTRAIDLKTYIERLEEQFECYKFDIELNLNKLYSEFQLDQLNKELEYYNRGLKLIEEYKNKLINIEDFIKFMNRIEFFRSFLLDIKHFVHKDIYDKCIKSDN